MLDVVRHLLPQLLNTLRVFRKCDELLEFVLHLLALFGVFELVQLSLVEECLLEKLGIRQSDLGLVVCLAFFPTACTIAALCLALQIEALRGSFCVFVNQLAELLLLIVLLQVDNRFLPSI